MWQALYSLLFLALGTASVISNKSINEDWATKKRPVNGLQDAFSYTWLKPMQSI
jgi:hypothetical protein